MFPPSGKAAMLHLEIQSPRLGGGPREARPKAAGAPCVPEPRGPAGRRDPDRRPDAGPGAAVAAAAADRAAGLGRGSRASWRGAWRPAIGRTTRRALSRAVLPAGRKQRKHHRYLPAEELRRSAGEGAGLRGMDRDAAGNPFPGADGARAAARFVAQGGARSIWSRLPGLFPLRG